MAGREYLNFDLELTEDEGTYRARVLDSPAGESSATFELPFTDEGLENFVLKVGRTRSGVRRFGSPQMEMARSFGGSLYEAAMTGEVETTFRRAIDAASREAKGLRIRLRIAGGGRLHSVPWEYMYSAGLSRFLVLSAETPLVRYVDLPNRPIPLPVEGALRILLVVSSPVDVERLDADREVRLLRDATRDLLDQGLIEIDLLDTATLQALRSRLRTGTYHVLHFIGHGGFDEHNDDGLLVFEDQQERARPVSGHDLGMMLHDHTSLRLLVLNACEGSRTSPTDPFAGVAQALVRQGMPAVVGMQFEITDTAAITFSHELYAAVVDGYPIDAAAAEARKAIFASGNDVEWGTPVLHMRAADGVIFDTSRLAARQPAAVDPAEVVRGLDDDRAEPSVTLPSWADPRPESAAVQDASPSVTQPEPQPEEPQPEDPQPEDPEPEESEPEELEPEPAESGPGSDPESTTEAAEESEAGGAARQGARPTVGVEAASPEEGSPDPGVGAEEQGGSAAGHHPPAVDPVRPWIEARGSAPGHRHEPSRPTAPENAEPSPWAREPSPWTREPSPWEPGGSGRTPEAPVPEEPAESGPLPGTSGGPVVTPGGLEDEVAAGEEPRQDHRGRGRSGRRAGVLAGAGIGLAMVVAVISSLGEPTPTTAGPVSVPSTADPDGGDEEEVERRVVEPGGLLHAGAMPAPALDGRVGDDWPVAWGVSAETPVFGEGDGIRGEGVLGWDEEALYVGAVVDDPSIDDPHASDPDQLWRGDSLSFEFGMPGDGGSPARAGDLHVMLGPTGEGDGCGVANAVNVGDGRAIRAGSPDERIEAACLLVEDGYVIEAAVPWSTLGVDGPNPEDRFLLNLNVSDVAAGGELAVMVSSNPDRDQTDRRTWQSIQLDPG